MYSFKYSFKYSLCHCHLLSHYLKFLEGCGEIGDFLLCLSHRFCNRYCPALCNYHRNGLKVSVPDIDDTADGLLIVLPDGDHGKICN
jgi:hypothetical protein